MSVEQQFEQFYERIQLTSSQIEDAKTKYNGVCKKLHDYYYPENEYSGATKLLIGSYGKRTNIRPPRDVDVLFFMPDERFDQYDDNESNGQSQLLQDIKNVLSEKYTTTDKIKGWGKVVLIEFSDGTHNIELLPAWEQDNGKFIIPNTESGGFWETWDPRAEIQKIEDSDHSTQGKTRFLIRVIKKWSENCSTKLKSFEIEKYVLEFLSGHEYEDMDYAILARDFFTYASNIADNEHRSHLETARDRAIKACDFEDEGKIEKAIQEWKKIFGDDFQYAEEKDLDETKPTLADYSHCELLRWLYRDIHRVRIDAYIYTGNKEIKLGGINSDGRNLSTGLYLKFIANTNTEGEFKYYWQVVNTGEAARIANDLRGKLFECERIRWEHTKYRGKHWIECFIVQNNICVARSGKFFVNIK